MVLVFLLYISILPRVEFLPTEEADTICADLSPIIHRTQAPKPNCPRNHIAAIKSLQQNDASKSKYLVFKVVSYNISVNDLFDFNKINHADAERMTPQRPGKNLPFIKLKVTTQNKPRHYRHNFQGRVV